MSKEEEAICGDCKGIMLVGGAEPYQCTLKEIVLDRKTVEERIPIRCKAFDPAARDARVRMREFIEVGMTTVYGNGSVQIPNEIRKALEIVDGDKLLWIRKGHNEYTFRKVGFKGKPDFKPHFV